MCRVASDTAVANDGSLRSVPIASGAAVGQILKTPVLRPMALAAEANDLFHFESLAIRKAEPRPV
jgi:hypothetical protein